MSYDFTEQSDNDLEEEMFQEDMESEMLAPYQSEMWSTSATDNDYQDADDSFYGLDRDTPMGEEYGNGFDDQG